MRRLRRSSAGLRSCRPCGRNGSTRPKSDLGRVTDSRPSELSRRRSRVESPSLPPWHFPNTPFARRGPLQSPRPPLLLLPQTTREMAMALEDEVDEIFRREVKSLPAYAKAQAASGSGVAPPVDEMNHLLMGLAIATQRSLHLLAQRIENMQKA